MLKKISLMLMSILLIGAMAGCGGANPNTISADKTEIVFPKELMFTELAEAVDTKEPSRIYFETAASLEDIQTGFQDGLLALKGTFDGEMTEEEINTPEIIVPAEDAEGKIVWVGFSTYPGEEKTPCTIVVAEQDGMYGVSVAVGARARVMAQQFKVVYV